MIDPILITGCARSGTSMTAGIISACGAFGGKTSGPNRWNAKGMFENTEIREKLVKPHLQSIGVDPKGQWPLPDTDSLNPVMGWRSRVESVFEAQGYKKGPWYYKGAKMCLVWPIWVAHFPEAKWVIVRRPREEIIQSCLRTGFMRAFNDAEGWGRWVDHHLWCFNQMKATGADIFEFWPGSVMEGKLGEAQDMIEWLGLNWRQKSVENFIDRRLWHGS